MVILNSMEVNPYSSPELSATLILYKYTYVRMRHQLSREI